MWVKCVDNNIRLCFLILAEMMIDYKEQTMIIRVKSERHCLICTVLSNDCENLLTVWNWCTHQYTHNQLNQQWQEWSTMSIKKQDEIMYVHKLDNFVWKHLLMNIHDIMQMNILHQLLKDVLDHTIIWIKTLIVNKIKVTWQSKNQSLSSIFTADKKNHLDDRFCCVLHYSGL